MTGRSMIQQSLLQFVMASKDPLFTQNNTSLQESIQQSVRQLHQTPERMSGRTIPQFDLFSDSDSSSNHSEQSMVEIVKQASIEDGISRTSVEASDTPMRSSELAPAFECRESQIQPDKTIFICSAEFEESGGLKDCQTAGVKPVEEVKFEPGHSWMSGSLNSLGVSGHPPPIPHLPPTLHKREHKFDICEKEDVL